MMNIGIVGLGAIAPFFLKAIAGSADFDLVAACDLNEAKLAQVDGVEIYHDYLDMLDKSELDAVIITLPNDGHAAAVLAALDRGIHVCCEKPLAITSTDAETMVRRAAQQGRSLFTAFHRRYNSNIEELAGRLPARAEIVRVVARYHENIVEHTGGDRWYLDPQRCGGGCLIDNGPNALDTVRHLVGDLKLLDATIGDVRGGCEFYAELVCQTSDGIPVRFEIDWALPIGEVKDVTVHLRDGSSLSADMLAGFDGFKASLAHEYAGILADFQVAIAAGPRLDPGADIVALVEQAYQIARKKEHRIRMSSKEPATARLVKLLFHTRNDRAMTLSSWTSRCVSAGQVHELVTTVDRPAKAGDRIDRVGFLGFAEFGMATVLERGDEVFIGDERVGKVSGFDECHYPNHYNIIIETDRMLCAADLDLMVGDDIRFQEAQS